MYLVNIFTDFIKTRHARLPPEFIRQRQFSIIQIYKEAWFAYNHKQSFPHITHAYTLSHVLLKWETFTNLYLMTKATEREIYILFSK
jgi:hypothetical protein